MFIEWARCERAGVEEVGLNTAGTPRPATQVVHIGADGSSWIEGYRCAECAAAVAEPTLCCRACGSRTSPTPFESLTSGRLVTWAVVHRSFPGVTVPFVSAIVDLDGGLTLKGTLRDADEADLRAGLPVKLEFDDAGGAVDGDGNPYVGYHFRPAEEQA